jgi:hypothetical protein
VVGWWTPVLLKGGVGRRAWLRSTSERQGADHRELQTDGVHATSNGEPYAGPDRPLCLPHKDGVRSQASLWSRF